MFISQLIKKLTHKRPKTRRLLQDNIGGTDSRFMKNRTPKAQKTVTRFDKWDYIKIKCFCTVKETIDTMKQVCRMEQNLCQIFN